MDSTSVRKVLVVSNRPEVIKAVKKSLGTHENTKLVYVKSVDEAIEKIVKNGFSITIMDCEIDFPAGIKLNDVIKLNYTSCKHMMLISNRSVKKAIERLFTKKIEELPIWNITGVKNLVNQVVDTYGIMIDHPAMSQQEMFDDIYGEIKQIKSKSFFFKHPNFSIV